MISSSNQSNAPADTFSLYTNDNEFRTFAHGIDYLCKTAEKFQSFFFISYGDQLFKRSTCAKSSIPAGSQHNDFCVSFIPCAMNFFCEFFQYFPREGIALRMKKFNGCDSVMCFGFHITVLNDLQHKNNLNRNFWSPNLR